MKRANDSQTIRSEGGLLPPDLLRRVLDPKAKLEGTRPEDYGPPQGERGAAAINPHGLVQEFVWPATIILTGVLPHRGMLPLLSRSFRLNCQRRRGDHSFSLTKHTCLGIYWHVPDSSEPVPGKTAALGGIVKKWTT